MSLLPGVSNSNKNGPGNYTRYRAVNPPGNIGNPPVGGASNQGIVPSPDGVGYVITGFNSPLGLYAFSQGGRGVARPVYANNEQITAPAGRGFSPFAPTINTPKPQPGFPKIVTFPQPKQPAITGHPIFTATPQPKSGGIGTGKLPAVHPVAHNPTNSVPRKIMPGPVIPPGSTKKNPPPVGKPSPVLLPTPPTTGHAGHTGGALGLGSTPTSTSTTTTNNNTTATDGITSTEWLMVIGIVAGIYLLFRHFEGGSL